MLLLAGAACLGAVAAVCSLLLTGTPLHAITANTAATVGLGSLSRSRAAATGGAGDPEVFQAGGAGDHEAFRAGHDFVPVPRLRDEPPTPAGPVTAADSPNSERWVQQQRRLGGESTPLPEALLNLSLIHI